MKGSDHYTYRNYNIITTVVPLPINSVGKTASTFFNMIVFFMMAQTVDIGGGDYHRVASRHRVWSCTGGLLAIVTGAFQGYNNGVLAATLLFFHDIFGVHISICTLLANFLSVLAVIIGYLIGDRLYDRFGRRYPIILTTLLCLLSSFIMAASSDRFIVLVAYICIVFATAYTKIPSYIDEVCAVEWFGPIFSDTSVRIGTIIGFVMYSDKDTDWSLMTFVSMAPLLIISILVFFMPESPKWLVMKGRSIYARHILSITSRDDSEIDLRLAKLHLDYPDEAATERNLVGVNAAEERIRQLELLLQTEKNKTEELTRELTQEKRDSLEKLQNLEIQLDAYRVGIKESIGVTEKILKMMKDSLFERSSSTSAFHGVDHRSHYPSSTVVEEELDPFALVENELSVIGERLRSMVAAQFPVPFPVSAALYFFKEEVEGKRFRPTVLLLMGKALNVPLPGSASHEVADALPTELWERQQAIAEITEMIHVASLLHDDVLDDADTRRGVGSLNFKMGDKKLSVLAGDFLLSRACVALAALKNMEVVSLLATVVEHLAMGETMQMKYTSDQRCSMEYYLEKAYYKTASLISNSCKAITLLAGQTAEVSELAFEYGRNLGLAFQLINDVLDFTGTSTSLGKGPLSDIRHGIVSAPILYAMEEFLELRPVISRGLGESADVDLALDYLAKSKGIERTKELAEKHASLAAAAINSLPESDDEDVLRSRRALVDLTHRVITRTK